jgi:hypothetical protein
VIQKEYHYTLGEMAWKDVEAGRPIHVEGPVRPAGDGWEILMAVPKVMDDTGEWKLLWVWERDVLRTPHAGLDAPAPPGPGLRGGAAAPRESAGT